MKATRSPGFHRMTAAVFRIRGSAMLELAIALPVYLAIVLAIVDFGGYFNERLVLTSAAYNGAKARGAACGSVAPVETTVQAAIGDMLSAPDTVEITNSADGATPIRRYAVNLAYARPSSGLSLFTAHIPALSTISATGVALCALQCAACS